MSFAKRSVFCFFAAAGAFSPQAPAAANQVAAYAFDEGAGATVADSSGNGNNGVITAATWTTGGRFGNALSFDGVSAFVTVNDSASHIGDTGTVEAWVNLSSINRWNGVVSKGNQNAGAPQNYAIEVNTSNRVECTIGNGVSFNIATSANTIPANTFTHIACTWDGATVGVYINGVSAAAVSQTITPAGNTSPLYIGQFGGNVDRLAGIIDEVRIYNRALSASEISVDMNSPISTDTTPPTVSITSPAANSTVSGCIAVTANTSDNVAVAGVQFLLDGANLGAEVTASPYSVAWNTASAANGSHTLSAKARDTSGNVATSQPVTITVANTAGTTPPIISAVQANGITSSTATISWTTDKLSDSQVSYGATMSYGVQTPLDTSLVTSHSITLSNLSSNTPYHYLVASKDAAGKLATSTDFTFTTTPASGVSINGHTVLLDSSGKIVSWFTPTASGYDLAIRLPWKFMINIVPNDRNNGLPYYYTVSCVTAALTSGCPQHNPAGLYAMLVDSALAYYQYSGDLSAVTLAKGVVDYQLIHGMTSSTDDWASMPYASSNAGETTYMGAGTPGSLGADGTGVIEPDKTGEFGYALLKLYEFYGDTRYRDTAIQIGAMLAAHVRPGDSTHSPWPFRVYASNNVVREEYTADTIGPIRLLDELVRLNLGNVAAYQASRQIAWTWLMTYPVQNNVWANYFEDRAIENDTSNWNQYNALETARYLLRHPEFDSNWQAHVTGIIQWVENTFGVPQFGANTIEEQIGYTEVTGSHTARYASINAMFSEATGDLTAKDKAYRAFNYATYHANSQGFVIDNLSAMEHWFTDGTGDYVRHFAAGVGAVPEWAPPGENHLLRSTSVVRTVAYQASQINYTTYDSTSTEVLRLGFVPASVTADGQPLAQRPDLLQPGWTYDPSLGVLRVFHTNSTQIQAACAGARRLVPAQ